MTQPDPLTRLDKIGHEVARLRDAAEATGNTAAVAELARLSAKLAAVQARIFEAATDAAETDALETQFTPQNDA